MHALSPGHLAAIALERDPRALLDDASQHLRQSNRWASLAARNLDDHRTSGIAVEVHAAARAVVGPIGRLDGLAV